MIKKYPANTNIPIPSNIYGYNKINLTHRILNQVPMYLLIVKPKEKAVGGSRAFHEKYQFKHCYANKNEAYLAERQYVLDDLERHDSLPMEAFYVNETICTPLPDDLCECPGKTGSPKSLTASSHGQYSHLSEIHINSDSSSVDLTIDGDRFTPIVSGMIFFKYKVDKNRILTEMYIQDMEIKPDDILGTKIGDVTDIKIHLIDPAIAYKNDTSCMPADPCKEYVIPVDKYRCNAYTIIDGERIIFPTENSETIKIKVDNDTRTLKFEGKLKTDILADGDKITIDTRIKIVGDFQNFPPKAVGDWESTPYVECVDNMNSDIVRLNTAGSFDVYDSLHDSCYQWYKDYRTPLEIAYTRGMDVIIPKNSLSCGIHNFTLVVTDKFGLVDTDVIQVEVRDETPPKLFAPPDRIRLVFPPAQYPASVGGLGVPIYEDDCAGGDVAVSNDAPSDLLFPEGETVVTWKAEDGHGNMTKKEQKVFVFVFRDPKLDRIADMTAHASNSIEKITNSMELQKEWKKPASVDLKPMTQTVEQMIVAAEMVEINGMEHLRDQIIEKLQDSYNRLNDASAILDNTNVGDGRGMWPILSRAIDQLATVQETMNEISALKETYLVPGREQPVTDLPPAYSERMTDLTRASFSDHFDSQVYEHWELEEGWRVQQRYGNQILTGEGRHAWARLNIGEDWSDYTLRCRLKVVRGKIHINYRVSRDGRYFVYFSGDVLYLQKEMPRGEFFEIARKHNVSMQFNTWYEVEIRGEKGRIQILVGGERIIDAVDRNPLTQGTIAFEMPENSLVQVDDVEVITR